MSKKDKRVEIDSFQNVEDDDFDTSTSTKTKKSKKSKKSKRSKDPATVDDTDDDETKSDARRGTRSSKDRDRDTPEDDDAAAEVFDDEMLAGEEELKPSKKKKKSKKAKKARKGVTFDDTVEEEYFSDADQDTKYDDEERTRKKKKKKKKRKEKWGGVDDDVDDDDDQVLDDNDDWGEGGNYSSDEDDYQDEGRRGNRRRNRRRDGDGGGDPLRVTDAEVLVSGETPRDDSPEMRLLNRFRIALRQVGAHSDGKGFITALHNHFVGVGRTGKKRNQIEQGEFRERLKSILRDTEITDYDVKRLMEILDSDGNGIIDWDEFVSFLSFPSKEMRKLVVSLRKTMIEEAGSSGVRENYKTLYDNLLDAKDRRKGGITLPKLQGYIQRVLRKKLTPGEIAELFRQIDVNNDGKITQSSLACFLKKNTHDLISGGEFDDTYPIVDVAVSASTTDEANLRHLKYHKINENLNEGAVGRSKVYLWWRSASMEDYDTEAAFLKDRVTDIIVSSKHRDSMLTAEGKPTRVVWQGVAGCGRVWPAGTGYTGFLCCRV